MQLEDRVSSSFDAFRVKHGINLHRSFPDVCLCNGVTCNEKSLSPAILVWSTRLEVWTSLIARLKSEKKSVLSNSSKSPFSATLLFTLNRNELALELDFSSLGK